MRQLTSPGTSVRPCATTRKDMMGFSLNLMLRNLTNIRAHIQFWLKMDYFHENQHAFLRAFQAYCVNTYWSKTFFEKQL
jgi:hypothetical protein